ncbi:MAG: 50S ribosomal protein L4 [Candidatus Eremiobacteraeota bacterium]|nr:50S ribosomal protein L4 [Candidatus Eremiobacteraeota bacterium]MBC5828295.1 50S ribosomal protein L4 [Candidatus Eremiobacteraeota bacterium]
MTPPEQPKNAAGSASPGPLRPLGPQAVAGVFSQGGNVALLHRAVVRDLANRRAGTADTKRRDDVRGGGRKPWRQKGTGRARQGSIRSPQWRKGGVVFGPHPRSFAVGLPRKARRKALALAVGAKAAAGALSLLSLDGVELSKTRHLVAILWPDAKAKATRERVLVVVHADGDADAPGLAMHGRNLARASVVDVGGLSVHALLAHDRVVMTKSAYDKLAEVCGAGS